LTRRPSPPGGSPLAAASALIWGLQFAFLSPVLALLLVGLYGATPGEVGVVIAVYNAAGFAVQWVVPRYADPRQDYLRPMLVAGLGTLALTGVLAWATSLPPVVLGLVLFGAPAGIGTSMLWAHLGHTGTSPAQIMNLRALFSFAWVAGPPLATAVMAAFGDRAILVPLAAVVLANIATTAGLLARQRGAAAAPPAAPASGPAWSRRGIAAVFAAFVLLQATNTAAVAVLALYVTRQLGLDVWWAGIALGLAAGLEIPVLMLVGRLIGRFPTTTLLAAGCAAGVAYYGAMTLVAGPAALLALQVLNAAFYAVVAGVGLTWFQEVIPGAARATSLYANSNRVAAIAAGPLIGVAGLGLGYRGVFGAAAVVAAVALGLILVVRLRL
jgi:SET family sugar efflux transporter-like MFS transporter